MRKVKRCFTCYKPTDRGDGGKSLKNCMYYSEMSAEERNEKITSAISYCKVANFEYIDEVEAVAEEEAQKASTKNKTTTNNPDRASYWEESLKDRYEVQKVEEFNAMGKGNKSCKQMVSVENEDLAGLEDVSFEGEDNNYEVELIDEETAASGILTGRRPYRKKILDSAESLPLTEGEGRSFRVKGFNQNQRAVFVQIMMRFGVGEFDWAEFTPRLKQKTCEEIKEYGTLFLTHIAEDITDSLTFSDGVPKEELRIEDVLVRIAVLLLIRDKVKAASKKPGTPLFPDDIVSRFPGLKSGRFWKEHYDLLLLRVVLKHGYGRWQAIVDDKDLKVQEVICQELNLPVITLPVPGASQSQDGANVVNAETPMNETKGTVVGNDLAVDAANRAPGVANRSQLFQDSSSLYHYREMQRRQVEFIKKMVLFLEKLLNTEYQKEVFGDTKANETPIEEPEIEAKVLDIPSPCSMDIDSQTSNQLPQVINGVPKGLRIEDVLGRIAVSLLIRDKVKAASKKPGTPSFPDDIVSRFPRLKSGRR
ncbi:CHD3-type chromatin-remodeling factor PICKLE-like [Camellia sinensis]|uniref:CHD3-type chromatin-remodeling factor PICKLE-like n=1 Tax=Camellia sinensis TaxID=4442 RepID=UPI001036C503|nr:CHD3-type chromatin-remodeling factor PICKLE-like [Camellia sinensis]